MEVRKAKIVHAIGPRLARTAGISEYSCPEVDVVVTGGERRQPDLKAIQHG